MAIVGSLAVFSEFSFDVALIQNQSAERKHYDTAWTLGLLRGFLLTGLLLLLAIPAAAIFDDERMAGLVTAMAVFPLLEGFANIGVVEFRKQLVFGKEFLYRFSGRLGGVITAVSLAILWDTGRPVLFRQRRCGKNGKEFVMLKFRSMRVDADQIRAKISHLNECDGPVFKINNDPRFTRVGRILRKYSLDELPQFCNVLRGDMSVVGPRPLADSELRTCPSWREARLRVKPGLTGLWQVSSREKTEFRDWIQHDLRYVREQSLTLDMTIVLKTVAALTRGF